MYYMYYGSVRAIPTYTVYQLYDKVKQCIHVQPRQILNNDHWAPGITVKRIIIMSWIEAFREAPMLTKTHNNIINF